VIENKRKSANFWHSSRFGWTHRAISELTGIINNESNYQPQL